MSTTPERETSRAETYGPVPPEHVVANQRRLAGLVTAAHRACRARDGAALSQAVAEIVALAPGSLAIDSLAIDLTAVVEIAPRDLELASLRWTHLSKLLA